MKQIKHRESQEEKQPTKTWIKVLAVFVLFSILSPISSSICSKLGFSGNMCAIIQLAILLVFIYYSYKYIANKESINNPLPIVGKILKVFFNFLVSFITSVK